MVNIGIVGATGYTGAELLRLLVNHPEAHVQVITSRRAAGISVKDIYPNLRGFCDLIFVEPEVSTLSACDLVFFATPHGVAHAMAPDLLAEKVRVIDISADFRLRDPQLWAEWYGQPHSYPELLDSVVYGLPEINRTSLRTASLVACPGCYPTSIQLGFWPLLANDLVKADTLIANSASGASGAGRQANINNLLSEITDSFKAYSVNGHRHLPEIEQGLRAMQPKAASAAKLTFVPHLLPIIRGIHSTLYATLAVKEVDLQALYEEFYCHEPFVDVLPAGVYPQTRSVRGSNHCRLAVAQPQGRDTVVVMSVIDNLTKGASGQAVQNMNIMYGFEETLGLTQPALLP
ncbi:MAG: N-acetyl-gamma-glutamyl-phosphate reductase [Cellvibrionaceae bacterium]|jgi:N-acetyl-gamma-glutamyl-phosphate reductase